MHTRKIVVLAAVLALLGGLAYWAQGPGRRHRPGENEALFPALDRSAVQTVTIEGPGGIVLLSRGGEGKWFVGEQRFPAADKAVTTFLEDLPQLRMEAVASTNAGKRSLFGVDEETGTGVTIGGAGNAVLAEFTVGSPGPDPFTSYVLVQGRPEVLLVSQNLNAVFGRPGDGWREHAIVPLEKDAVEAVAVRAGEESFTLRKDGEGGWELDEQPVDPQAVEGYLDQVTALRASAFADGKKPEEAGLDDPATEVTLSAGEKTVVIAVGALEEELRQRYVKTGDSEIVYLVSQYVADGLLKKRADFQPPPGTEEKSGE